MNVLDSLGHPIKLQDTVVYTPFSSNFLVKGLVVAQKNKNFIKLSVTETSVPRIVTIHRLSVAVINNQLSYNKANYPENQI